MPEVSIAIKINYIPPDNFLLTLKQSQKITKKVCDYFNIPVATVDHVESFEQGFGEDIVYNVEADAYGYYWLGYQHIELLKSKNGHDLFTLLHELSHHVAYVLNYPYYNNSAHHGYYYQLAKKRVKTWAKKEYGKKLDF